MNLIFPSWPLLMTIAAVLAAASAHAAPPVRQLNADEAQRWLHDAVAAHVNDDGATAAAAVVVQGGKTLAQGTFGWFDPVRRIPISTHDQFLVGSVTKTFVGLVLARLVDDGRIASLDDPANRYLKRYRLPGLDGAKVSLRQLSNHTSGLDSRALGTASGDQTEVPATAEYLAGKLPPIVRTPGFKIVYSNFGPPLLGAIAEDVTGERFDRLVDRLLLRPLEMRDTVLNYDPSGGSRLVYAGLRRAGSLVYATRTLNVPFVAPAGSIQTTAEDMSYYLNALLGHDPDAVRPHMLSLQQSAPAVNHPGLEASGVGIFLAPWNGVPVWRHSGLLAGFRSQLVIVPSLDFGIFVVFAGGRDLYEADPGDPSAAADALLRTTLGDQSPAIALPPAEELSQYVGRYWTERRAHGTPEVIYALNDWIQVRVAANGGLRISGSGSPEQHFVEIAPGLFQGPARAAGESTLYGFEAGTLLMHRGYAVRVSGLGDPVLWRRTAIALLTLCATSAVSALFLRIPGRYIAGLAGSMALACTYAFVWPEWRDVDLTTPLFLGQTWRFTVGRFAAWTFLAIGVIGSTTIIRDWRARRIVPGRSGWVAIHQGVVAFSCLGLTAVAVFVDLLP